MTKAEAMRLTQQETVLLELGFTREEAEQLRRISLTLRKWSEHECNGAIERDEATGKPYWSLAANGGKHLAYRIPDREAGALARLEKIVSQRNKRARVETAIDDVLGPVKGTALGYYHQ